MPDITADNVTTFSVMSGTIQLEPNSTYIIAIDWNSYYDSASWNPTISLAVGDELWRALVTSGRGSVYIGTCGYLVKTGADGIVTVTISGTWAYRAVREHAIKIG